MNASIISIGNELLSGRTVDTNAAHLAAELLTFNIPVAGAYTVPDEIDPIVRALTLAAEDADIIFITGGLGPTSDDLTRDALAEYLHVDLQLHQDLLDHITSFFTSRNRPMADTNKSQACLPAGATALHNSRGTAPGIRAEHNAKIIFAMPGVPHEMKQMFADTIAPELAGFSDHQSILVRKLQCYGTGESNIAEILGPMMDRGRNPLINCTASAGIITLHIIATAKTQPQAAAMAHKDEKILRERLGNAVFGQDDQTLAQAIGEMLLDRRKTITTAESCTAGLIAKLITDAPGASEYFKQSWITYSDQAKSAQLDVPEKLIAEHGAVSDEVARAMAAGARKIAHADYAIATTGIAGPTGATQDKPLGLVYIALACDDRIYSQRCVFPQPRSAVRMRTALTALNMLRLEIAG